MVYPSTNNNTSKKEKKEVNFVFECCTDDCSTEEEKENKGFAGLTADEYIDSLGFERSEELSDDENAYGDFFKNPKIMSSFTEFFDLSDRNTRKTIMRLTEADQNVVLTALTSKMYDYIVSKIDDIDYGDIPLSKGDITKISNYDKLTDCVNVLRDILIEYKQDTAPLDHIAEAISNISTRKDLFERAFKFDAEMPIIMYNTMVLSIIDSISYMISTCIEFIKTPNQNSFSIVLDKIALNKTKNNMIYRNLQRFNKCCSSGDFDKSMNHIITARVKGYNEAAVVGTIIGGTAIVLVILSVIIPILRELVFLFYHLRMKVCDFFEVQANLLQMNAYNLQNDESRDEEEKERIVSSQLKIVELFRKIANKMSFSNKKAEVDATKEIESTKTEKLKLNGDIDAGSVSALF